MKKKVMEEGKAFFDVWMYEVSDQIQALATAFGDRFFLESALNLHASTEHKSAKVVLERCIYLHAISHVKQNIDWYIINGIVSVEAASELDTLFSHAVKEIVPHMNTIVESLGLPKTPYLYGPIARNYVAFNA